MICLLSFSSSYVKAAHPSCCTGLQEVSVGRIPSVPGHWNPCVTAGQLRFPSLNCPCAALQRLCSQGRLAAVLQPPGRGNYVTGARSSLLKYWTSLGRNGNALGGFFGCVLWCKCGIVLGCALWLPREGLHVQGWPICSNNPCLEQPPWQITFSNITSAILFMCCLGFLIFVLNRLPPSLPLGSSLKK